LVKILLNYPLRRVWFNGGDVGYFNGGEGRGGILMEYDFFFVN
jgi:predicted amidohydrolase